MTYSDTTTKLGLIQDCEQLVFSNYGDISNNTNRLYDFNARINRAYDKLATIIMGVDGRWQFDDTNYTDVPIGQTNIVAGQKDYTFDVEFMDIVKVVCIDAADNRFILRPFDINDSIGESYLTELSTMTSTPVAYDKTGAVINLYPTPSYSYTNGLIVHYRRKPSYFAYNDTTKAVGIPAVFHRYLSLEASADYAISKQLQEKNDLVVRVKEMEESIKEFYSARSKDEQKFIRPVMHSSR